MAFDHISMQICIGNTYIHTCTEVYACIVPLTCVCMRSHVCVYCIDCYIYFEKMSLSKDERLSVALKTIQFKDKFVKLQTAG